MWYHQPQKQRIAFVLDHIWLETFMWIIFIEQISPCNLTINWRQMKNSYIIHKLWYPHENVNEFFHVVNNDMQVHIVFLWFEGLISCCKNMSFWLLDVHLSCINGAWNTWQNLTSFWMPPLSITNCELNPPNLICEYFNDHKHTLTTRIIDQITSSQCENAWTMLLIYIKAYHKFNLPFGVIRPLVFTLNIYR